MSVKIHNDQELREALSRLPIEYQRQLGARFVANVSHLSGDPIVAEGLAVAGNPERTAQALESAYKSAKKFAVESYTACGRDADWSAQAEHFLAAAISACLLPEAQLGDHGNLVWKAAMQARMAKNCDMILNDRGELDNEANRQYAIAEAYLAEADR